MSAYRFSGVMFTAEESHLRGYRFEFRVFLFFMSMYAKIGLISQKYHGVKGHFVRSFAFYLTIILCSLLKFRHVNGCNNNDM